MFRVPLRGLGPKFKEGPWEATEEPQGVDAPARARMARETPRLRPAYLPGWLCGVGYPSGVALHAR